MICELLKVTQEHCAPGFEKNCSHGEVGTPIFSMEEIDRYQRELGGFLPSPLISAPSGRATITLHDGAFIHTQGTQNLVRTSGCHSLRSKVQERREWRYRGEVLLDHLRLDVTG